MDYEFRGRIKIINDDSIKTYIIATWRSDESLTFSRYDGF